MLPPELYQLVLIHFLQMLSCYDNLALGGLLQSCQHVQHRRFTGTGGSHDRTELPAVNRQIHTVQRPYLVLADPVDLVQILYLNHRFSFLRHALSPVRAARLFSRRLPYLVLYMFSIAQRYTKNYLINS